MRIKKENKADKKHKMSQRQVSRLAALIEEGLDKINNQTEPQSGPQQNKNSIDRDGKDDQRKLQD